MSSTEPERLRILPQHLNVHPSYPAPALLVGKAVHCPSSTGIVLAQRTPSMKTAIFREKPSCFIEKLHLHTGYTSSNLKNFYLGRSRCTTQ